MCWWSGRRRLRRRKRKRLGQQFVNRYWAAAGGARGTTAFVVVDLTEDVANFNGLTIRPQELARFTRPRGGGPIAVYKLLAEPFAFPPP